MAEVWKTVSGYGGFYDVSDRGRVRSRARGGVHILAPGAQSSGHVSVVLGRGNTRTVHSLVAEAFIGPRPLGCELRHLNGAPADNRVENLQYATRARNGQDKKFHAGAKTYRLKPEQAAAIKRALRSGATGADLARQYGVAQSTISAIKHDRFHRDVDASY